MGGGADRRRRRQAFCAGMDLKAFSGGGGGNVMAANGGFTGVTNRDLRKPLIAACNGPALAGVRDHARV